MILREEVEFGRIGNYIYTLQSLPALSEPSLLKGGVMGHQECTEVPL